MLPNEYDNTTEAIRSPPLIETYLLSQDAAGDVTFDESPQAHIPGNYVRMSVYRHSRNNHFGFYGELCYTIWSPKWMRLRLAEGTVIAG
jgi:hypothetical protein